MRISKEPEVRKREIIDVAMKVFARKGYEATTMKDIAGEAGVVAGLCYHYFQNKHELYLTAMNQYAREISRDFTAVFRKTELPIEACMEELAEVFRRQEEGYRYQDFFEKEGNELFHKQLELAMAKEVVPCLEVYLRARAEKGEIRADDPGMMAKFLWEGQAAVLNEHGIALEERIAFAREAVRRMVAFNA